MFGGMDRDSQFMRSGEKFRDTWKSLPELPSQKYAFTPCHYSHEIYLPEVNIHSHSFDIFTILTETYRSFPFSLTCFRNGSVSFIVQNGLYLLTMEGQCMKWDLKRVETGPVSVRMSTMG